MATLGIDPGKTGSLWLLSRPGDVLAWTKMPDTEKDLWDWLAIACEEVAPTEYKVGWAPDQANVHCYIEKVHSSPQMGVKSAFTFGQNFGMLRAMLTAIGWPWEEVRPQVWQKSLGCMTKGDKHVSKRKAQQLFPKQKFTLQNADGCLIAEYGARQRAEVTIETLNG